MKRLIIVLATFILITLPVNAAVERISLDEAVDIALKNNLELQAKMKDLEIAKANIKAANALKNPQMQSNFLFGKVTRGNSSQFGLYVPVEVAKRGLRKKTAEAELKAADNSIKEYRHKLKVDVMRAYFRILYLKSVVMIMHQRENLFEDMKKEALSHSKSSPNYKIEILQSDIKYKKQLIELNRAKANLLAAQFNFNKVLNLGTSDVMYDSKEASLFEDLDILNIEMPSYDQIEKIAMVFSYSLRITDNYIERSEYEVKSAEHLRIPDITVGGGYAYQTKHQTKDVALPGAFLGVNVDVPILYSYRPEINRAKLILEKTKMDKVAYENKLKLILKENYNDFKYAKENTGYYKEILNESEEILKMSYDRYKSGKVPLMNVMLNETAHQQVLNEYIDSVDVYYQAYLNLMYNVGHDLLLKEDVL